MGLGVLLLKRNIVGVLSFIGLINAFFCRINLSIAIVDMTANKTMVSKNGETYYGKEFDWNQKQKGLALSAFYIGYLVTQLPGGWAAANFGGAAVFNFGLFTNAIVVFLQPLAAYMGFNIFLISRIVSGICQGVLFPSVQAHWAKWAPPAEKTRLCALTYSGTFAGCAFSFPVCGVIVNYLNWQAVFYISGATTVIFCIIWFIFVPSDPADDYFITEEEQRYLKEIIPLPKEKSPFPWGQAMLSLPLWSIVVTYFCSNWGLYTSMTQLPTYLNQVYNYDINKLSLLTAAQYILMGVCLITSGILSDELRGREILTTTQTRKTFNTIAFATQAIFMIITALTENITLVLISMTIAFGAGGIAWSAFSVNPQDIAPQHASIIYGFSNTFSTLSGIVGPILAGMLTPNGSEEEWKLVLLIISGVYIMGCVNYLIFASGELQPWAQIE